jgi:hypothetical protein
MVSTRLVFKLSHGAPGQLMSPQPAVFFQDPEELISAAYVEDELDSNVACFAQIVLGLRIHLVSDLMPCHGGLLVSVIFRFQQIFLLVGFAAS